MIEVKIKPIDELNNISIRCTESTHCAIILEKDQILGYAEIMFTSNRFDLLFSKMITNDVSLFDGLIKTVINYCYLNEIKKIKIIDEKSLDYVKKRKIKIVDQNVYIKDFVSCSTCMRKINENV
ncbi:MAG: hypothetical protein ACOWWH_05760 [Eubacteriaceae bacterium]